MELNIVNICLAFLEGFALIISPCILPVLPLILSGSLEGSKSRPFGLIIGFILAFSLFTFFSREIVNLSGIDLNIVRNISLILLLLLGVMMVSTFLSEKFNLLTSRFANIGIMLSAKDPSKSQFLNGILFGILVGLVWTPCAGPILAAVIVQTVLQQTNLGGFLIVLSFGIGAGVPMLLIALFGRKIMTRFQFFKQHGEKIRKMLGVIIILSVAYLFFSTSTITLASTNNQNTVSQENLINGLTNPYPAPAIGGIDAWINSQSLTLNQLKGKVVLIDFWTYSCINCLRTLPYLKDWYQKYHDKGLVIIGIHTPEFEFEKDLSNVKNAVIKNGILYPVALDSHFVTWQNFKNQYWPAHFLINKNGEVVYEHFGEGEYDVTENNIRFLLGMNQPVTVIIPAENIAAGTPETYLGYARSDNNENDKTLNKDQSQNYSYPKALHADGWALRGNWLVASDKIISTEPNAALKIHFRAKNVFAVMGSPSGKPIHVKLTLNGKSINTINVTYHDLYSLVKFNQESDGMLELTADSSGLEIYTFTFG